MDVLLILKRLVVYASEVVIVELYVSEFGTEDVHFAAILKDDFVV